MPDYTIAMQNTMPQIQSPNELMANAYTLQNAKQANQLGQMKMDEYTRGLAETSQIKNALTRLNPASPTYRQDRQNAFALQGPEGLKTLAAIEREEAQTATAGVEATGKKVTNLDAIRKHSAKTYQDIIGRPSDANVTALYEDAVDSGLYPPEALVGMKQRSQQILSVPAPINPTTGKPDYSLRQQHILQMNLEAEKLMGKTGQRDIGGSIQDIMTNPVSGEVSVTGTTPKTLAPYKPEPSTDIPKLKPGEVWDATKQTVKQIPGSAEYNKQSKVHGTDYNATKTVISKMDNAISKVNDILSPENKSGFEGNFGGYNAAITRQFTGNTAKVKKNIETVKADMKSAGLELVRSGGSIGALTEREWPMLEAQIDAIDYMLDEKDAEAAFKRVISTFERIKDQAKDTYQTTWGETQYFKPDAIKGAGKAPAAPAASAAKTKDQLDYEAYLKSHLSAKKR
jgi:hypothetical protein